MAATLKIGLIFLGIWIAMTIAWLVSFGIFAAATSSLSSSQLDGPMIGLGLFYLVIIAAGITAFAIATASMAQGAARAVWIGLFVLAQIASLPIWGFVTLLGLNR